MIPVVFFIYSLCLYKVYKQSFIYSVWFSQAVWLDLGSLGKNKQNKPQESSGNTVTGADRTHPRQYLRFKVSQYCLLGCAD